MNAAQETLAKVFADVLDQLLYGKRNPYGRERKPGTFIRQYFRDINAAIDAARTLKAIPPEVPKFSSQEILALGAQLRSFATLRLLDDVRQTFIQALRDRGIPDEILSRIYDDALDIGTAYKEHLRRKRE